MHTETAAQNEIIDKIGEGLQNLLNGAKVGEGWRQRGGGGCTLTSGGKAGMFPTGAHMLLCHLHD